MPELPDLQVFSRNIHKEFAGKEVQRVKVIKEEAVRPSAKEIKQLEHLDLEKVRREGKELYFEFENNMVLAVHLMLHGKFYQFKEKNSQRHTLLELLFEDGMGLALTDFQGKAHVTLNPAPKEAPDALSEKVNGRFLAEKLKKKRASIKSFLLDQKEILGIGNAYADEILWQAKISPLSIANKIPEKQINVLADAIKDVLKEAEKQIKKTHPDIINGEVRDFLNVHNPHKKESPTGAEIKHAQVNSRRTYYTEEQELYQ